MMAKTPRRKRKPRKKRRTIGRARYKKSVRQSIDRNRSKKTNRASQLAESGAKGIPLRIHFLKNFRHIQLSDYVKELPALRRKPNHILVLSEGKLESAQYYLSTLKSVKKSLRNAKKPWPTSRKSFDPTISSILKRTGKKIPAFSSLQYSEGNPLLVGPRKLLQAPVFVHITNAKPASLVFSREKTIQSDLSSDIKGLLLKNVAGPASTDAPSKAFIIADSIREHDDGTVLAGVENIALPPETSKKKQALLNGTSFLPVYPEIEIANPHPVQGSEIDIAVSLNLRPSEVTKGAATAPADLAEHVFDVHLLLGKFSAWKTLKFRRPAGTTEMAHFKKVQVPELDSEFGIPSNAFFEVCVNFYLENRWCGEAVRRIEVLAGVDSPKLAIITTPEAPPWRRDLHVTPGTEPADLLIRINKGVGTFEFEWSLYSPFMNFQKNPRKMRISLDDPPYAFVKEKFEIFAGADLDDQQIKKLNARCDLIFQAAPQGFREAYRELALAAAKPDSRISFDTIQIVSDDPFIPWELMRVSDPSDNPAFRPEILCVKHNVGRWIASDSTELGNRVAVETIAVSVSDYMSQNVANLPPLPWAAKERDFLVARPYNATDIPLQLPKLTDFLENRSAEILHFSCHGSTDVLAPDLATLSTEDDETGLQASFVSTPEVRAGLGKHHPVIFLNACQAAKSGSVLGMVFGWPQAFLRMGATACVAPLWKVVDERAKDIAETFYQTVLTEQDGQKPLTLGEALRRLRAQWKDKRSLTYLGYVLYGDPTTRLTRKNAAH
jgi:hypothetical protein